MLSSLLLYLPAASSADIPIEFGVELAKRRNARVRGLTLLDTRRLSALVTASESAISSTLEFGRLGRIDHEQGAVRESLSQACLRAEVNFDIRRAKGDPFDLLPFESQFHDLVITAFPTPGTSTKDAQNLAASEIVGLLARGVQPLCVLRTPGQAIRRVLLVGDGAPASARALRHFAELCPFPDADHRVLAIHGEESRARELQREMVEFVRHRLPTFENGWIRGSPRRALIPYARKWQADLVVTGVANRSPLLRPFLTEPVEKILRATSMGVYVTA